MKPTPQQDIDALRAKYKVNPATGELCRHDEDFTLTRPRLTNIAPKVIMWRGNPLARARVIWAITYGEWPRGRLYPKNRLRGDTRPANLTPDPRQQGDIGGVINPKRGVRINQATGMYDVYTPKVKGISRKFLGSFASKEDAIAARAHYISTHLHTGVNIECPEPVTCAGRPTPQPETPKRPTFTKKLIASYPDEFAALRDLIYIHPITGNISRVKPKPVNPSNPKALLQRMKDDASNAEVRDGPYVQIHWNGRLRPKSHIVWAVTHGEWPQSPVYHKNRMSNDCRPANLTLDPSDRIRTSRTPLPHKGVMPCVNNGWWKAYAPATGGAKRRLLGLFPTKEQAIAARAGFIIENVL